MWWFIGVKKAVEKLEEEVKQLKCKHPAGDNIFVEKRYYVLGLCGRNLERKCSKCGAILESFGSEFAMQIAKGEWHKKEAERLDVDKLLGTEYLHKKIGEKALSDAMAGEAKNTEANIAGVEAAMGKLYTNIGPVVFDGDFIKKTKGRWVHERSGKVLKVKK